MPINSNELLNNIIYLNNRDSLIASHHQKSKMHFQNLHFLFCQFLYEVMYALKNMVIY